MNLYYANVTNNPRNTGYPNVLEIKTLDDFVRVVQFDHVAARYKDYRTNSGRIIKGHRSIKDFISSDCLMMDCDNTSSDPLQDVPKEFWKTPSDVASAFPDVPFYVCYSRNHMKDKDGKAARPKFHIYFPLSKDIDDVAYYGKLKEQVLDRFPAFDANAKDGARFFFGVKPEGRDEVTTDAEYHEGHIPLDLFLKACNTLPEVIQDGERNDTLHRFAVKYLKRYGDGQRARDLFRGGSLSLPEPFGYFREENYLEECPEVF